MHKFTIIGLFIACWAQAAEVDDVVFKLNASVVKVQVNTPKGDRGIGSGVVISQDQVVTNCHVVANAIGVAVTKNGETYQPVAMKADWHHDLCILKLDGLPIAPVPLGDASTIMYEAPVFSIGYPNNPMKPLTAFGKIKGIYNLEDGQILRTTAAFRMGASGGALFDEQGRLIGINTFKSPGRKSNYYSLPVVWAQRLLNGPEIAITTPKELPFWDAPEEQRPFFMQVINAQIIENWQDMAAIAQRWVDADRKSSEPWYALATAQAKLGNNSAAIQAYQQTIQLNPRHVSALYDWGLLADQLGNSVEVSRINGLIAAIDNDVAEEFKLALAAGKN